MCKKSYQKSNENERTQWFNQKQKIQLEMSLKWVQIRSKCWEKRFKWKFEWKAKGSDGKEGSNERGRVQAQALFAPFAPESPWLQTRPSESRGGVWCARVSPAERACFRFPFAVARSSSFKEDEQRKGKCEKRRLSVLFFFRFLFPVPCRKKGTSRTCGVTEGDKNTTVYPAKVFPGKSSPRAMDDVCVYLYTGSSPPLLLPSFPSPFSPCSTFSLLPPYLFFPFPLCLPFLLPPSPISFPFPSYPLSTFPPFPALPLLPVTSSTYSSSCLSPLFSSPPPCTPALPTPRSPHPVTSWVSSRLVSPQTMISSLHRWQARKGGGIEMKKKGAIKM